MKEKVNPRGKIPLITGFLLVFSLCPLFAGFNENLDAVMAQEYMTAGAASYMILVSLNEIPDNLEFEEAAKIMAEKFPKKLDFPYDKPLTLGEYSLMIMLNYDLKGGLMYSMSKIPRYAITEMRFQGFVKGRTFARMSFSGERGIRILGRVTSKVFNTEQGGS